MQSHSPKLLRVNRAKAQTIHNYNRISRWYDAIAGVSERRLREAGLRQLNAKQGETILEIGYGTGHCTLEIAKAVGDSGKVCGIDISDRMYGIARERATAAGIGDRIELCCGDALTLPYPNETFNGLFMSFTLELFGLTDIDKVLQQCKRVLKQDGRLCTVAMSSQGKHGIMMRIYEWAHTQFPKTVDCRPIYAEQLLHSAGFVVSDATVISFWGLSIEIVRSRKREEKNLKNRRLTSR